MRKKAALVILAMLVFGLTFGLSQKTATPTAATSTATSLPATATLTAATSTATSLPATATPTATATSTATSLPATGGCVYVVIAELPLYSMETTTYAETDIFARLIPGQEVYLNYFVEESTIMAEILQGNLHGKTIPFGFRARGQNGDCVSPSPK